MAMPDTFFAGANWQQSSEPITVVKVHESDIWPVDDNSNSGTKDEIADGLHPIVAIGGRTVADGRPLNLTGVVMRYLSSYTQPPVRINIAGGAMVRQYVANILSYTAGIPDDFEAVPMPGQPVYIDDSAALSEGVTCSLSELNEDGLQNPLAGYLWYAQNEYADFAMGGPNLHPTFDTALADELTEQEYCVVIVNSARDLKNPYIINDEFLTALAAGAVDGTLAEPGPGIRHVVDTGNFLSIIDGKVDTTDAIATGDPRLYYTKSIAKVAGRFGTGETSVMHRSYFGFDIDLDGAPVRAGFFNTNYFTCYDLANTGRTGPLQQAVDVFYEQLVVLRRKGCFCFVRGGVTVPYPYYELMYMGDVDTFGIYYFGLGDRVGGGDISEWKNLKVPKALWLPTPIATDGFGGVVGTTDGEGHQEGVFGGLGVGGSGIAWTDQVGTWAIAGGIKNASALAGGLAFCTVPTSTSDLYVDVEVTRAGGSAGIVARYADSNNYLIAYHDGVNVVLDEVVGGVPNNLISAAIAYVAGAVLALSLRGTQAELFYNLVNRGNTITIDATLTAQNAGLYSTNTANTFDNFRLYAKGTSGEYNNYAQETITNQTRATVNVPDGADILLYLDSLKNGDILSLATNGSYTMGAVSNGIENLPSGYPDQPTVIQGNNATITGGASAMKIQYKKHLKIKDLNIRDQTAYCLWFIGCENVNADGIDISVDAGTATVDATRFDTCRDFYWKNCSVHDCDVNHASFDGFEIFNNCHNITFFRCTADTLVGHITPAHHGFEVYAPAVAGGGVISTNIEFIECSATGCEVGFSADGGLDGLVHTGIITQTCSGYDNRKYGYEGIQSGILYRKEVASGNNTGNTISETSGNVTDLS